MWMVVTAVRRVTHEVAAERLAETVLEIFRVARGRLVRVLEERTTASAGAAESGARENAPIVDAETRRLVVRDGHVLHYNLVG